MKSKVFVLLALFYLGAVGIVICQSNSLTGVWMVVKTITYVSNEEQINYNPPPNMIIFAKKYYSIIRMAGTEPQKNYEERWYPTDEEKVTSYNSIIANAGTYSIENNLIITKPTMAKTPDFVNGYAKFIYEVKNDMLELTLKENISNDGIPDSAAVEYKTTLFLKRIEEL